MFVENRLYLTAEHFALLISDQVERYQGQSRYGSTDTWKKRAFFWLSNLQAWQRISFKRCSSPTKQQQSSVPKRLLIACQKILFITVTDIVPNMYGKKIINDTEPNYSSPKKARWTFICWDQLLPKDYPRTLAMKCRHIYADIFVFIRFDSFFFYKIAG